MNSIEISRPRPKEKEDCFKSRKKVILTGLDSGGGGWGGGGGGLGSGGGGGGGGGGGNGGGGG